MDLKKVIYVYFFWEYAKKEEIEDMMFLSIPMISEYIIEVGKQYYNMYAGNNSLLARISLEKVKN